MRKNKKDRKDKCLSVSMSPCSLPRTPPTPWDMWAKGTQKNDVTSLYWTKLGRYYPASPNDAGPLLGMEGEEACTPKMPTSASALCPCRCPLDGASGQCGPQGHLGDGQGLGSRTFLPVPSLCRQRRGERTVQQRHREVRGAGWVSVRGSTH